MGIGLEEIRALRRKDRQQNRRRVTLALVVLAVLSLGYLCLRGRSLAPLPPWTVFKTLWAFLKIKLSALWQGTAYENREAIQRALPYYGELVSRFRGLVLTWLAGAILALSGTVYQIAMRNPMAVPTMLGVSSGVSLAQMILVLLYGQQVYYMAQQRYIWCYGLSLGVLLVILLLGKLAGGKRAGVTDMLLVGTVVNRGLQLVMNYLQTGMDTDTLEIYQEYAQNSQNYFNTFADVGILALVAAVVLLPLMGMRFSYNLVSFADEDGQTLGVRPAAMRVYGLVAGGILTATAMIHAGNIGMIATVTPLLCRYIYGADFKNLMGTSAIWGAALLLAANILRGFTYIGTYQIPLGNLVSLLAVPLLIWVVWKQKTAWSTYER